MEPKEIENGKLTLYPLSDNTNDLIEYEKQYFTFEDQEDKASSNSHENAYENAGIFSCIFFKWVSPIINVSYLKINSHC